MPAMPRPMAGPRVHPAASHRRNKRRHLQQTDPFLTATRARGLLALLFVGVLMGALDLAIIGPALPAIQAGFGMTERQLSVLFNAYVLCQMIGTPLLAKVGDRVGSRTAYLVSIGLFAAGSLLLVVAASPEALYWGRALQGFGGGGIFPVAAAVIGNAVPPRERGRAFGVLGTVFGLAFIVGPVMGGLLLPYGWHWLFAINLPICAGLVAAAWWLLPNDRSARRAPFDYAGIGTLAVMLTALVFALSRIDTNSVSASLSSLPTTMALLLFVAALPVFWRLERRAEDPVLRPGLLTSRPVATVSLIGAGVGAIQSGGVFYPALAVAAIGVSESAASWLLLPGVVVATAASPITGRLVDVVGPRACIAVGMALVTASVLGYGLLPMSAATFILASVVGNAGMGAVLGAPLRLVVMDNSLPAERGAAQGLLSNFTSAGRLLGAAFVGSIAASAGGGAAGYRAAFMGIAAVAALMVVLALSLQARPAGASAAVDNRPAGG